MLYIYAVESSRRLIARTAIGDRAFLHCTGVGKAILGRLRGAWTCQRFASSAWPSASR